MRGEVEEVVATIIEVSNLRNRELERERERERERESDCGEGGGGGERGRCFKDKNHISIRTT